MDHIEHFNKFALAVAKGLNDSGVKPPGNDMGFAVLVMVHPGKGTDQMPIGGALNYVGGKWVVDIELQYAKPLGELEQ